MSFVSALQGEELAVFEKYLLPTQFPRGACIMNEGDPGDGCYIIDEGTVRLELKNVETDTDSVLGFLESGMFLGEFSLLDGMFLGEFSLLDGKPRSASAYADTDVKARWFSKTSYEEMCQHHPRVGLNIATALGQNLTAKMREFNEKIAGYIFAGNIDKDTQESFEKWPEDRVDALLGDIAEAIAERAEELAEATVAETSMGIVTDKADKIRFASIEVYKTMSGHSAAGLLTTNPQNQVTEIASPVGVVLGLIPVTNPVPTVVFKTLVTLKGRNALILSCHRSALGVGSQACDIICDVLERHGASRNLVQAVRQRSSRQKTMMFMNHPGVSLILATGGTSMVKAAYSSGTPAIGVGSGNAPVLVCTDADLSIAAQSIIQSKSFDNGVICGSENNLVVLTAQILDPDTLRLKSSIIGKPAKFIADIAGIRRDRDIRLIVVPVRQDELQGLYGHEKLAPILSLYTVNDEQEGIQMCRQILLNQGRGHTAVIYTQDQELMHQFGREIEASRILVNASASQGCIGIGTGLIPSFTLGCGTFGGNSTTDNVGYRHLLNIKRLALSL